DQRGIGDAHTGIFDERQLALGSLARIGCVDDLVGNARDTQPSLELAAERADVRDSEHPRELEQLDGRLHGILHELDPSEARAANASRSPFQPLSASKMPRISSRRAP